MALVKRTALAKRGGAKASVAPAVETASVRPAPKPKLRFSRAQTAGEQVAAATQELASGVVQASAAAEELRRSLEQIASAAEEAAGAAHESLSAVDALLGQFGGARDRAAASRLAAESLQSLLTESSAQIETSVEAVKRNAARQLASLEVVSLLETQAAEVGQVTRAVADISDQTNLLALNAAIEAARAGDEGRGFAVVADEVRVLAVAAEARSAEIQQAAGQIGERVRVFATRLRDAAGLAGSEADAGAHTAQALAGLRADVTVLAESAQAILRGSAEAEAAVREAQQGAESVSSAAEEQSAAAAEAQRAVQQQAASLEQSGRTAQLLADRAEQIQAGVANGAAVEMSAAAEQLSATVQELSGAATEILAALDQITRGAQSQAAAAAQSQAALGQVNKAAQFASESAIESLARIEGLQASFVENRAQVGRLTDGVSKALEDTRAMVLGLASLEGEARAMEKLVDAVALIAVQTGMLAVSGAVEAARAGEKGRGFANVSGDIRTLARDAGVSADRAKDLVRNIQVQIVDVRRDLDQMAAVAEAEVVRNTAIDLRLGQLATEAETVRSGALAIRDGAVGILSASAEILQGAGSIATAADEASAAAAQSATAAREQASGAEDLAAAIEEIAALAAELEAAPAS